MCKRNARARRVQNHRRMSEQRLIDAVIARAGNDARAFRDKHHREAPNDLWIENSYTAALPLAQSDAGIDAGHGPHPEAFAAYRTEIRRHLGERPSTDAADELTPMPTPGEH